MKNERLEILESLLEDVRTVAADRGKSIELEDMFLYKSIIQQIERQFYITSDLSFAYLCNEIGLLQGKLEYEED